MEISIAAFKIKWEKKNKQKLHKHSKKMKALNTSCKYIAAWLQRKI